MIIVLLLIIYAYTIWVEGWKKTKASLHKIITMTKFCMYVKPLPTWRRQKIRIMKEVCKVIILTVKTIMIV